MLLLGSQYEPLILAISFPLIAHRPWRLRGNRLMDSPPGYYVKGSILERPKNGESGRDHGE
jgi:hypothetical protein